MQLQKLLQKRSFCMSNKNEVITKTTLLKKRSFFNVT